MTPRRPVPPGRAAGRPGPCEPAGPPPGRPVRPVRAGQSREARPPRAPRPRGATPARPPRRLPVVRPVTMMSGVLVILALLIAPYVRPYLAQRSQLAQGGRTWCSCSARSTPCRPSATAGTTPTTSRRRRGPGSTWCCRARSTTSASSRRPAPGRRRIPAAPQPLYRRGPAGPGTARSGSRCGRRGHRARRPRALAVVVAVAVTTPQRGDLAAVEAQLRRPPRGVVAVARRCPCGLPDVVATAPRLDDGTPFPTTLLPHLPACRERDRHAGVVGTHAGDDDTPRGGPAGSPPATVPPTRTTCVAAASWRTRSGRCRRSPASPREACRTGSSACTCSSRTRSPRGRG